jgi:hypothetical protein
MTCVHNSRVFLYKTRVVYRPSFDSLPLSGLHKSSILHIVYTYTDTCVYTQKCVRVCVRVCVCVCVCVYVCVCMYIHTCIYTYVWSVCTCVRTCHFAYTYTCTHMRTLTQIVSWYYLSSWHCALPRWIFGIYMYVHVHTHTRCVRAHAHMQRECVCAALLVFT